MLKAIETIYKGYRFRSRLEARWAVFFDVLHIAWEYEKEGYDLDGIWYLPDFWLPKQEAYFEVKPAAPTEEEIDKAKRLVAASGHRVLIGLQIPDEWYDEDPEGTVSLLGFSPCLWAIYPDNSQMIWDGDHMWSLCPECGYIDCTLWGNGKDLRCGHAEKYQCWYASEFQVAYDAARSARFEHGESGR